MVTPEEKKLAREIKKLRAENDRLLDKIESLECDLDHERSEVERLRDANHD